MKKCFSSFHLVSGLFPFSNGKAQYFFFAYMASLPGIFKNTSATRPGSLDYYSSHPGKLNVESIFSSFYNYFVVIYTMLEMGLP